MKRAVAVTSLLLLVACLAFAQSSGTMGSTQNPSPQNPMGSAQTFDGCLSHSANDYVLTTSDGRQYRVSGDTARLNAHVGHEMAITGEMMQPTSSETSGDGTLAMQSFKHIAAKCPANSGMGGMGGMHSDDSMHHDHGSMHDQGTMAPPASSDTSSTTNGGNPR